MKKNGFRQGLRYFEGQKAGILWCIVFSIFCSILPLVLPILEGNMLGRISTMPSKALAVAGWLFGVGLVLEVCQFFSEFVTSMISTRVEKHIKLEVLAALSKIKIKALNSTESGTFTTRINQDAEELASGYAAIFAGLADIFSHTAFLVFVLIASPWLGLFTLLGMLLQFGVEWLRIYIWAKGKLRLLQQNEKVDSVTNEMVMSAKESKQIGNESFALKKAEHEFNRLRRIKFEESQKQNGLKRTRKVLEFMLSLGFVLLSIFLLKDGALTLSTFFVVYIYRMHIADFLTNIVELKSKFTQANLSRKRIDDVVEGNRKFLHQTFGDVEIVKAKGELEAQELCFHYYHKRPILKNCTLKVVPGELVAIIGKSGSGKSTLLGLLAGQLLPSSGQILVDQKPLSSLTKQSQEAMLLLVPTKPFFFSGSIKENLLRANPNATFEQMVDACKKMHIHDAISSRPKAYDAEISERSVGFSAGERQRLGLARALLKGSKILLLDEPTQAQDDQNKDLIIKTILELSKSHTVVVATHDEQLTNVAHRVLTLKSGRLTEHRGDNRENSID